MTGLEFHLILTKWCDSSPYRMFKDTAGNAMLVISADEFHQLCEAIREKCPAEAAP